MKFLPNAGKMTKRRLKSFLFFFWRVHMTINEMAISMVRYYISKIDKPENSRYDGDFYQLSYTMWAANEILSLLKMNKKIPPLTLIEEFAQRMNEYSCMNIKTSYGFSVAHDTAVDIIDMFVK